MWWFVSQASGGVGMVDRWLCPLMALLAVSMDPSQPEASVSGTVRPSCGSGILGFIIGLKKYQRAVENCP